LSSNRSFTAWASDEEQQQLSAAAVAAGEERLENTGRHSMRDSKEAAAGDGSKGRDGEKGGHSVSEEGGDCVEDESEYRFS